MAEQWCADTTDDLPVLAGEGPSRLAQVIAHSRWRRRAALAATASLPLVMTASWLVAGAAQPTPYDLIRHTVSELAEQGRADRWIVTAGLYAVSGLYLVAAFALGSVGRLARALLVTAGLAAAGIAANPQPEHGYTLAHLVWTGLGASVVAIWPLCVAVTRSAASRVIGLRVAVFVTAGFLGLLAWFAVEAAGWDNSTLGLSERLASSVPMIWPFVVAVATTTRRPLPMRVPVRVPVRAPVASPGRRTR